MDRNAPTDRGAVLRGNHINRTVRVFGRRCPSARATLKTRSDALPAPRPLGLARYRIHLDISGNGICVIFVDIAQPLHI